MSDSNAHAIVIETGTNPVASIIWLHGLGADGSDFEPIVPMLGLPPTLPMRFVFPHAPIRPITINGGMAMRGWYDIRSMDIDQQEDEQGIRESAHELGRLFEHEVASGIPSRRIVLAGFSQGGAIALFQGLRQAERPAGILALSTYLPMPGRLEAEKSDQLDGLPVFMGHGSQDPIVPIQLGEQTRDILAANGLDVEWRHYPMGHSVNEQEIGDIGQWIGEVLSR